VFVFICLSFSLFFLFFGEKFKSRRRKKSGTPDYRTNGLKKPKKNFGFEICSNGFEWTVEQSLRGLWAQKKKADLSLSLCKLRYFTLLNLFYLPQNALRRARSQEYTRDKIRKNAFLTSRSSPRRERERERAPLFFSFSFAFGKERENLAFLY